MLKIKEDIISKINDGSLLEHHFDNLELKSSWTQEYGKKISALANKNIEIPNWLCVGINDSGQICDNDDSWAQKTEELLSQQINHYLDPQQACKTISCHHINNKWFIIIELENPGAVVYWNKKAYKAAGTTILEMEPEDIMGLTVKLPGLSDYTAQKYEGSFQDDLVQKYAQMVSQRRKGSVMESIGSLSSSDVLQRIGIHNKITSNILFGNIRYRMVYYDKNQNPIENEVHNGLYGILHDDFIQKIQDWSKKQLNIKTNPYPELALKEALANAVAHAAYFEDNGDVILELYTDKVSISNLCLRESSYFANRWFSSAHKTVNRTLMETLRLSGNVDELGRGKNLIFSQALKYGKKPPQVVIEKGGRFNRWRLFLYGGIQNKAQLKLLSQLKEKYNDEQKALIANALVLWRGQSVSKIREFIEGESQEIFIQVLRDLSGPVFYYEKNDEITLRRWVRVLIGEGKDSKQLTAAEEKDSYEFVKDLRLKYHHGFVTPKELRDLADLGDTKSSQVMSSKILKKWTEEGKMKQVRKGLYQFKETKTPLSVDKFLELVQLEESNG